MYRLIALVLLSVGVLVALPLCFTLAWGVRGRPDIPLTLTAWGVVLIGLAYAGALGVGLAELVRRWRL